MKSTPRRLLLVLLALLVLLPSASATWSIVAVNRRTGEVCVASATCIPRVDLTEWTPVILVGVGGGVTQAALDDGSNKLRILDGFLAGDTPQAIMARIRAEDSGFRTRQIGIVDFTNDPLSFTGGGAGRARKSVAGVVGDIAYAIQGNILASENVIVQCENTLRASTGDLGQRVLAAMVRARQLGGDGRCSCFPEALGDCGVPPANFEKSAHVGYLLLARIGDADGSCMLGESCADGPYYLRLNIQGSDALHESPDPVDQLVERYAAWRASRAGRPDGLFSRAHTVDSLPADGVTERTVTVRLVDLEGEPILHGGALVAVGTEDGAPPLATPGPVSDHGDGTYSFVLHAGTTSGVDHFVIRASDGLVSATLYPYLAVRSDPPRMLHAGFDRISASAPEAVPFVVDVASRPRGKYWLFASLSGGKLRVFEPVVARFVVPGVAPFFPSPPGVLDSHGRSEASYTAPPGVLAALIGMRLEWSAKVYGLGPPLDSNVVGFDVVP
jgi:hypothetical protein